ncbi:MAG: ABC transporter substrate-binding protein [Pseudomonadota bacterium]
MLRKVLLPTLCFILALPTLTLAEETPEKLVRDTTEKMLAALREEKAALEETPSKVYELVDKIVLPHFDFARMSKLVLARHWRTATQDQKDRFVKEFRALLVRTYATSLVEYSDEKVDFLPMRGDIKKKRVTVPTEVKRPGGANSIPITYDLYFINDEWKVYNVTVENISLVTNYRSTFNEQVNRGGLDKLIADLAAKTAKANQGSES